jgi:AcrR family transcriptional regulator
VGASLSNAAPADGTVGGPERQRDAERTRAEILDVATREFADKGYSGARVDEIAAKTRTTKRMIYYYFGGKEQLYVAALERAYTVIRSIEQELDVEHLDPLDAIRQLAELTFDHHESHPDFIRLVSIENIHRAEHIATSSTLSSLANPALDVLARILERGRAAGHFRGDVDALDVHMMISSFCVFRTANRYTFKAIFDRDMLDPARREHYRQILGDMVLEYLTAR